AGILHRDIKPSNIVLEPATDPAAPGALPDSGEGKSWRPRLIDFGLTKRLDTGVDYSRPGSPLGTPVYMPPEQVENRQDQIGPRSDLYSLGAVLYHCLTGQPPFPSDSEANTLQMVRQVDPPNPRLFNRGIPRDLETICLKCLRKQPAGRYATAADLAGDLGRFLEGRPILARPAGRVERLWRWARRNRKLATALAGLALALLVLVGVLGVYGWREARLHRLAEEEAEIRGFWAVTKSCRRPTAACWGISRAIQGWRTVSRKRWPKCTTTRPA
ncbi:MAG: serine/threonine protein kinase, partial [Gemmataceae bacterium]|nr:serine/threonine protein kinase [Gemmataceae bacterium]